MNKKLDADRTEFTWENLYIKIYSYNDINDKDNVIIEGWEFWKLFNFRNNKNGVITLEYNDQINIKDEKIKEFAKKYSNFFQLSGDVDFGEGLEKEERRKFLNFSLMPVKGGMNNKKGKFGYHDRLDMFIYILSLYYKNKDKKQYAKEYLICYKNDKSLSSLCDYLDLFDDIYDYCKKIYLLKNKQFISKLINYGKDTYNINCKIESNKIDLEEYSKRKKYIREEYWNERKKLMCKVINKELLTRYID